MRTTVICAFCFQILDVEDYENFNSEFNEKYSLPTRVILRTLSENSRTPITEIAKLIKTARRTAKVKLNRIEKELKIRYTLELDEEVLGIRNPHFIVVRFLKKPNYAKVASILHKSYIPQLVVRVKGRDEILIYANSPSDAEYIRWAKTTRVMLSKYRIVWESSQLVHKQLGFFPLRGALLDRLDMPTKYKELLRILNFNSRMSFYNISKSTGMHFNTVEYNFKKLLSLGYIKKFTLVCRPPENVSLVSIFSKFALSENFESDAAKVRKIFRTDEEFPVISRYLLISDLIGNYDFLGIGVFDDRKTGKKKFSDMYRTLLKRHITKLKYNELGDVLLGELPIRSVDSRKEYNTIKWTISEDETEEQ